jgi:hypothetical protein
MTPVPQAVPTLTEVIEIAVDDAMASTALPLPPDAMPLEDVPLDQLPKPAAATEAATPGIDAVLEQLQRRLDAWLRQRLAAELEPVVHEAIQEAASAVARELRAELPALVRDALQAAQRPGHPPGGGLR